jgi:serine acetyltransferase
MDYKPELSVRSAFQQLLFLGYELAILEGGKPTRWLVLLFYPSAGVVISYRIDRCGYLLFGRAWSLLRILLVPLFALLAFFSCPHEINFKADIGRGLQVRHPTLGVVVHGEAIVGARCILNGSNSIGTRKRIRRGDLIVGDCVELGINACILGPAIIGNNVIIGAGAIAISDIEANCVAVGIPAKKLRSTNGAMIAQSDNVSPPACHVSRLTGPVRSQPNHGERPSRLSFEASRVRTRHPSLRLGGQTAV